MSGIVKVTPEAVQAVQRMKQVINGPLVEQIDTLNRQGQMLSDPNYWDGRLALQFRNHWPETHQKLQATKAALEELRASSEQIIQNIMRAGGN